MPADGLRARRGQVEDWLSSQNLDSTVSSARYLLHKQIGSAIKAHVSGSVLEAGSGRSPFREVLERRAVEVVRLDNDPTFDPDVVGDVQALHQFADDSFDAVVCTQVLEHVPDPQRAVHELARVLRPGGVLILSAPHLSLIHEIPNDFYRFTPFALGSLVESAGLTINQIDPTAGFVAFLTHPISLALWSLFGWIPVLRWIVWGVNRVFVSISAALDHWMGLRSIYPTDHIVVAVKELVPESRWP